MPKTEKPTGVSPRRIARSTRKRSPGKTEARFGRPNGKTQGRPTGGRLMRFPGRTGGR